MATEIENTSSRPLQNTAELSPAMERCTSVEAVLKLVAGGVNTQVRFTPSQIEGFKIACNKAGSPHVFYDEAGRDRMIGAPSLVKREYKKLLEIGKAVHKHINELPEHIIVPDGAPSATPARTSGQSTGLEDDADYAVLG